MNKYGAQIQDGDRDGVEMAVNTGDLMRSPRKTGLTQLEQRGGKESRAKEPKPVK